MSPIQDLSDLLKSQYCPTCGTICTPSGRQVDHIKKKKCGNKASGKVQYTSCDIVFISTSGIYYARLIYIYIVITGLCKPKWPLDLRRIFFAIIIQY